MNRQRDVFLTAVSAITLSLLAIAPLVTNEAMAISLGSPANLDASGAADSTNILTSSGTNVYAAWQSTSTPSDIFFKASTNSGSSWGSTINLSSDTGSSSSPQIAASGSNVYAV